MAKSPYVYPAKGTETTDRISVIIPAAGMGTRMKSFGPKALIRLQDKKTVFDYQYEHIKSAIPNSEIILVTGFMSDKVMAETPKDVIKIENEGYGTSNVVRSLGIGLRAATGNKVLVIYGDLVFNKFTLPGLRLKDESLLGVDNYGYLSDEETEHSAIGCTLDEKTGHVVNMFYELSNKWSQILYLTGRELEVFRSICWNRSNATKFGFEALNLLINAGGKLKTVVSKDSRAVDIDTPGDIKKALEVIRC